MVSGGDYSRYVSQSSQQVGGLPEYYASEDRRYVRGGGAEQAYS